MDISNLTQEEFKEIAEKMQAAQKDDTPFAVVQGEEVAVVGDANKTQIKRHDYKVKVTVPKAYASMLIKSEDIQREVGEYAVGTVTFKDVYIKPRNSIKIMAAAADLIPFFNNLEENGSVTAMDDEELIASHKLFSDEVIDAMYRLVKNVLDLDDAMADSITPPSVIELVRKFIEDFPELFGETDAFFE